MAHQRGQHLPQLQEQSFAGHVVVGPHLEPSSKFLTQSFKQFLILPTEKRGRRDGYRLVTCREHSPAVGAPLGDEERLAGSEQVQHGPVLDAAL